jgi:hypothetical protein
MDNFLDFLNSAELNELTKIPGIDQPLAERIIAARPFEIEEDVLKVSGISEKGLAKIKTAFEKLDHIIYVSNTPARVPDKMQTTNATITIKTDMPQDKQPEKKSGGGFKGFIQTVFIILLVLAVLGGFAAAFYFGLPYFTEKVIQPIQFNTLQIGQIATQQASDLQDMQAQVALLQSQIDDLETRSDDFNTAISSHNETLIQLESMQSDLDSALTQLGEDTSSSLAEQRITLLNNLQYEITVVRATELLSRANLYLSQSNYGSARQDVLAAYSLLSTYQEQAPLEKTAFIQSVNDRLELALNNLPAYPVIAANDVLIAWQLLVDDGTPLESMVVPQVTGTPVHTPTPVPSVSTPEESPSGLPPATPTPVID